MEKENKNLTNFEAEEWRVGPKAFVSLVGHANRHCRYEMAQCF